MKLFLNTLLIFSLTSCAAWRLQKTEIVKKYGEELVSQKEKVKLFLNLEKVTHKLNGEQISENSNTAENEKMLNIIHKAYKEAGIFEFVTKEESDIEIRLSVEVHGKSDMMMTVLTAMTLFLFPSKTTDEFTIHAKFFKGEEEVGQVEKYETVTMYRQFFLIFAMPFKSPFNVNQETLIDLNRSVVTEAFDEGYFKLAEQDAPE